MHYLHPYLLLPNTTWTEDYVTVIAPC